MTDRWKRAPADHWTPADSHHALWKNPEGLTDRRQAELAWIAADDPRLHRAYRFEEGCARSTGSQPTRAPQPPCTPWTGG